jgi:23S rRNA (cytidine1920-2'-O)/16S rRNA (cytidine1409-2'-O)-methyltransferase
VLIKPQFEAGPARVGKGGVVRDLLVHQGVLREILLFSAGLGLPARGLVRSPITGPAGNVEFLAWLQAEGQDLDLEQAIARVTEG